MNTTNTTLYQLELDYSNIDCGMGYVFQLKNGQFFIIDGGFCTAGEEDRLYDFLKERCKGTPIIVGWFFSHAHDDHIGNFIQFIQKYKNQVIIEKLIYNFQPIDFPETEHDWKSSDPAVAKEFYRTIEKFCYDIPIYTPQTNDIFQIEEITVEVLYTHNDLDTGNYIFNDCSTVITTEYAGQKILWLGDIHKEGSRILLQNKIEKLQCDIVQVSHHGFSGAPIELYEATKAKAVLWPTPDYLMKEILNKNPILKYNDVNLYILNDMNIQNHWIGGNGTVEIKLPYKRDDYLTYPKIYFGYPKGWTERLCMPVG